MDGALSGALCSAQSLLKILSEKKKKILSVSLLPLPLPPLLSLPLFLFSKKKRKKKNWKQPKFEEKKKREHLNKLYNSNTLE